MDITGTGTLIVNDSSGETVRYELNSSGSDRVLATGTVQGNVVLMRGLLDPDAIISLILSSGHMVTVVPTAVAGQTAVIDVIPTPATVSIQRH